MDEHRTNRGGHWITISSHGVSTHVYLENGQITKGPQRLLGANIADLPPLPDRYIHHHRPGEVPPRATDHSDYGENPAPAPKNRAATAKAIEEVIADLHRHMSRGSTVGAGGHGVRFEDPDEVKERVNSGGEAVAKQLSKRLDRFAVQLRDINSKERVGALSAHEHALQRALTHEMAQIEEALSHYSAQPGVPVGKAATVAAAPVKPAAVEKANGAAPNDGSAALVSAFADLFVSKPAMQAALKTRSLSDSIAFALKSTSVWAEHASTPLEKVDALNALVKSASLPEPEAVRVLMAGITRHVIATGALPEPAAIEKAAIKVVEDINVVGVETWSIMDMFLTDLVRRLPGTVTSEKLAWSKSPDEQVAAVLEVVPQVEKHVGKRGMPSAMDVCTAVVRPSIEKLGTSTRTRPYTKALVRLAYARQ